MSMVGKTLGAFECTALIGKGGMGEVYKAKDQKLGRDVAIKVLPEEFAKDADRVARFQREAKLLASLNHPNIAAIHGLEESDGTHFLVLELIEGDTLADRIKTGPIPVEESLKLALQISEALEAAHEKGVIHRDLKPANTKVTPDGKVKVLDFGLAKAFAGDQAEVNLSHSPTLSEAATLQGVILGTAAYMSPEQARGKPVDKRTDIWAFGCVLYEMLTGQAAFQGEDVTEILAAVVKSGVNLDLLPPNIHPRVREVIIRCLQKEQKKRYGGIGEAQYEIEQVLADPSGVFVQPVTAAKPRRKLQVGIPWLAAAIVLASIIVGVAVWMLKPTPPPESKQIISFDYDLPEGQQFTRNLRGAVRDNLDISPDGSQFVYCTPEGLYLRSMKELSARPLNGTGGRPLGPFFSPDGQWIAYWAQAVNKLKKVAVSGGAPVVICDVGPIVVGARWNPDNTIVYCDATGGKRVPADGGTPEVLIDANVADIAEKGFPAYPQILPDGETLLFTNIRSTNNADNEIMVQSLESGDRKVLFKGGIDAEYLPTGHIAFLLTNNDITNLLAVPFDPDSLEITGGAVPLVERVNEGCAEFSSTGTLAYIPEAWASAGFVSTLVWVDHDGKEEPLLDEPDAYSGPRISPDGTKVALTINNDGNQDIHVWDIVRGTMSRLTFDEASDRSPQWTSNSKQIAFSSTREDVMDGIYLKSADGTGVVEKLGSMLDSGLYSSSLSADGKALVVTESTFGGTEGIDFNIGTLSLEGDNEYKALLKEEYREGIPKISPDGRWMAYWASESSGGIGEIYVRPFPNVDEGKWQVSQGGGLAPLWSPDGRELFYLGDGGVIGVPVESEPTFNPGNPRVLFKGNYVLPSSLLEGIVWDIHPIDKRFLILKPASSAEEPIAAPAPRPKINIVLNWFEELKDRVPLD